MKKLVLSKEECKTLYEALEDLRNSARRSGLTSDEYEILLKAEIVGYSR